LFEKERVDLRVSFLGEGATARAKDKVWDDAIISVFFFLNIYICVCVCVLWYIYIRVCEVKIFLPFKRRDDWTQNTNTCQVHTFSLSLSLSLWTLSLSLSKSFTFLSGSKKKRKKKSNQISFRKSGDFSKNPTTFCFSQLLLLRGIILSLLRVYSKERVGEKGEDKRV
jgi:hypothetical protein